jgi:hypothetical protein
MLILLPDPAVCVTAWMGTVCMCRREIKKGPKWVQAFEGVVKAYGRCGQWGV